MKSANFSTNLPPKILQNFAFYSPEISEALLSILHIGKIAQTWFLAWLFGFTSFHFPDFGLNLLNGFDLWWCDTSESQQFSVMVPIVVAAHRVFCLHVYLLHSLNATCKEPSGTYPWLSSTASSLLFFFAKLLHAKPKHASREAACARNKGVSPRRKKRLLTLLFCLGTMKLSR